MRKLIIAGTALAVLALSAPAGAQSYIWLGAGPAIPLGDTKDGVKTGLFATAGLGLGLGSGDFSLQVEGIWGSNNLKVGPGENTIFGGFVNLLCDINGAAKVHPYIYAGGGILKTQPEVGSGDSKAAFQGGAGLSLRLNDKWSLWGDARYLTSTGDAKITLLPITFGFSWAKGGN